jgi:anti-anti-sigma factor
VAGLTEILARAAALDDADLVLDLSRVQFMDAATIGVIVRTSNGLQARSRSLRLRSASPCAGRLLQVCGLAQLLDPVAVDALPPAGVGVRDRWGTAPAGDPIERPVALSPVPIPAVAPIRPRDREPGRRRSDAEVASARLATNVTRRWGA